MQRNFDKRKVELGNCGRPYQTPCVHEHACLRCPMLLVSPTMLDRLDVIEKDLHQRRRHADDQGWLGEIEGIDITLAHLDTKRAYAQRLTADPAANASSSARSASDCQLHPASAAPDRCTTSRQVSNI